MKTEEVEKIEQENKSLEERIEKIEKNVKEAEAEKSALIASGNMNGGTSMRNSDERACMAYFGVNHVSKLLHVNTGDPMYSQVPPHLKAQVLELKRSVDISRMLQQRFHGEPTDRYDEKTGKVLTSVKGVMDGTYYARNVLAPKLKAFDTTADADWVPTAVASQFFEEFELDRQVLQQFQSITMPTNPYDFPVQDSVTEARIQGENATITDVKFSTGKLTFDATKLAEFYILSSEIDEDSAPPILNLARREVAEAQMRAYEQAIINGDSDGTHQDTDTDGGAAELAAKSMDGLRKLGLANSANGSTVDFAAAAVTLAKLRECREAMGKFGVSERDLVWLVSSKVYNQMLALPEVTTVEKFGPMATVLRGALAALDGIPIIISEFQRDDVDATGVNSGGPNTFSTLQLVNRRRFYWGVRRPLRTRVTFHPVPPNDQWLMASWSRVDFQGHVQDAGEVSCVVGINIA